MSEESDNNNSVVEFKKPATSYARPNGGKRTRTRENKPPSMASMKIGLNEGDRMPGDFESSLDSNWGMIIGQHVICKVLGRERHGYNVVVEGGVPGFLKTDQRLKVGKKLTAEFICVMDNRALLASLPEQRPAGIKSFGMLEEIPHGGELVQLFGAKPDSE